MGRHRMLVVKMRTMARLREGGLGGQLYSIALYICTLYCVIYILTVLEIVLVTPMSSF